MSAASINRAASAMRTALVGTPMVRFDAPVLIGPTPQAGRIVESVEAKGKHVEVMWDDGLVLDTKLRSRSEWHVYRQGAPWSKSWEAVHATIQTDDFVAVCFDAAEVETYRVPDRQRHPGQGRLGPNLADPRVDLRTAVNLLLAYPDPEARLRDVMVDQHVMLGVGNVYRCEVLWACELSPWAHVGEIAHHDAVQVVNTAARMVRANQRRRRRITTSHTDAGLAVYGRCGQGCMRCHDTVKSVPVGRYGRVLYWCPGCQVRLDRRLPTAALEMDPHPAAAQFLNELPWRANELD